MKESFKHIADQLRCPSSSAGLEMGERMNQSNGRLISQTIELLDVKEGDSILEIGHGNGSHVADLFEKTSKITYKGLDISSLMNEEAQKRNQELIRQNKVDFQLYDGEQIPMEIGLFTKIFSVNTLYFIQQA
ncbi:MAG: class I SAM-dependent methyltransferase, partial [Bacteroidota bacterium]